jgi:signal peptidase I
MQERSDRLRDCLAIIVGSIAAVLFAQAFLISGIVPPCRVTSDSMEPTVATGSRLLIDRTAFWFCAPRRWDIVVFRYPEQPRELCLKRIAGLPGERLQIRDSAILIDGQTIASPSGIVYAPRPGQEFGMSPEYTLAADEYFVLGDNSAVSADSRLWEPPAVKAAWIVGKPLLAMSRGEPAATAGNAGP